MLAYCTALGLQEGWLVYAQGAHGVRQIEVRNTDVTIKEYPLDVSAPPAGLIEQIDALAIAAIDSDSRALAS